MRPGRLHGSTYILVHGIRRLRARDVKSIRHYSSLGRSNGVPRQVERIQMPCSPSASLGLLAPSPERYNPEIAMPALSANLPSYLRSPLRPRGYH